MYLWGGKMYYHVRIKQKSNRTPSELKRDLSEEKLLSQFIVPYENNEDILDNEKTIPSDDIEKIKIYKTEMIFSKFKATIQAKMTKKAAALLSDEEYLIKEGKDVTDDFIKGGLGYKKNISEKVVAVKPKSNQIFIVHGHDNEMKETVARVLTNIGLEPIILHEQANLGRTIIEKFESCSENVSFAVVLLSPDDFGYKKDQPPESAMLRARQNVILELGYFMGKLGRKNVVALNKGGTDFEVPSDILGILYISFDPYNGWKLALAKELETAGYEIDFRKL